MEDKIVFLENKRIELFQQLSAIGDLRRGNISATYRKCGKKNCVCNKKGHKGHGPRYTWTTTIKGKSYAKNLKLGVELEKYRHEISNYHTFDRISNEIIKTNEEICDLRPMPKVEDGKQLEELKKKLQYFFRKKFTMK